MLSEEEAEHAQIIVRRPEPDVVGLPGGWGETLTGEPMPNVVAAVRRVRGEHLGRQLGTESAVSWHR